MLSLLARVLLYRRAIVPFTEQEKAAFEVVYAETMQGSQEVSAYSLPYPKHRFLAYVIQEKSLVAHGSNNTSIHMFEPRRQTLFNGTWAEAVFATKDGIWPLFYAVLDKRKITESMRNACLKSGEDSFYYFSLSQATMLRDPWTSGMVYLLPSEHFEQEGQSRLYFDEWTCKQAVAPVLRISVDPSDFEFIHRVSTHKPRESMLRTLFMCKWRTTKIRSYLRDAKRE